MTSDRISEQREDVRFRVLRMLEDNPDCSQRDIARQLGVSLGAVNFCLNALIEKGHVKVNNFRAADNKLRYAYLLTPKGISEKAALTSRFLRRKLREYESLKREIEMLQGEQSVQNISLMSD
nr:MarR family EPS-associated transcriptional regulator [Oricola indica]